MALFDFFKKAELAEIKRLKSEVARLSNLKAEVERLSKFQDIADLNAHKERLYKQIEELTATLSTLVDVSNILSEKEKIETDVSDLKEKYESGLKIFKELERKKQLYTDDLNLMDWGVYEPHFSFDTSDEFRNQIAEVRQQQKQLIAEAAAVEGGDNISCDGSLSEGQAIVRKEKKLMLRAFNGESNELIASAEWNNVRKIEERIRNSREVINNLVARMGIYITKKYLDLKIKELYLIYEYKLKRHEEKEEQRRIREQIREEEKARKEYETARLKAEKEEAAYQKALEKARAELEGANAEKVDKLSDKIRQLEEQLEEAQTNKERAISMDQQTKKGHVYIISNIGSFGEHVYKIGLTRRLDPLDRVRELGDASVPFPFDVHAMIFSDDAPQLETELHRTFNKKRLNLVNSRKEFFNVSLSEIADVVRANHGEIEFTSLAEAEQYRETVALRQKEAEMRATNEVKKQEVPEFPETLF